MNLIMVAHGTRRPEGIAMISDIADQVGALLDHTVQTALADVARAHAKRRADITSALIYSPRPASRVCRLRSQTRAPSLGLVSRWPHTCWPTACSKSDYGTAVLTLSASRWGSIPAWCD
jgi:hypothetical protein